MPSPATRLCFLYAANIDCATRRWALNWPIFHRWQAMHCQIATRSGCPAGYPELHAETLSANKAMKSSITAHVQAGKPVWAGCGGMMALFDEIIDAGNGVSQPMWGVLPGRA